VDASYGPRVTKFGRTNDKDRRIREYPRGSYYLDVYGPVEDCHAAERAMLRRLRAAFRVVGGREYFGVEAALGMDAFSRYCRAADGLSLDMPEMAVPMDFD
jgi:hypothetical protein